MADANRLLQETYGPEQEVTLGNFPLQLPKPRVRLGAEFTVPLTALSLRAGYYREPSVLREASASADKRFYSGGIGFLLSKNLSMDITYVRGLWETQQGVAGEAAIDVDNLTAETKVNKLFVSAALRF